MVLFRLVRFQELVGLGPSSVVSEKTGKKGKKSAIAVKRFHYRYGFHNFPSKFMVRLLTPLVADSDCIRLKHFGDMKQVTGKPHPKDHFTSAKAWFDNLYDYIQLCAKLQTYNFYIRLLDLELQECGADSELLEKWGAKRSGLVGFSFGTCERPVEAFSDKDRAHFIKALVPSKGKALSREKSERQEWWNEHKDRYNKLVKELKEGRDWLPQIARKEDAMEESNPLYYKVSIVNSEHDKFCQVAQGGDGSMPSLFTRHSMGKFTEAHGPVCKRAVCGRCTVAAGLGDGFATLSGDETTLHRPYMVVARCWQEKRAFFLPTFQELADQLEREVVEKVTNWLLLMREVCLSLSATSALFRLHLFLLVNTHSPFIHL